MEISRPDAIKDAVRRCDTSFVRYAIKHCAPCNGLIYACVRAIVEGSLEGFCDDDDGDDFKNASDADREMLLYGLDAGFRYNPPFRRNIHQTDSQMHALHELNEMYRWWRDSNVMWRAHLHLHKIRVVQRHWRSRCILIRRTRAARLIQDAYVEWICRPRDGHAFKRARVSFYYHAELTQGNCVEI